MRLLFLVKFLCVIALAPAAEEFSLSSSSAASSLFTTSSLSSDGLALSRISEHSSDGGEIPRLLQGGGQQNNLPKAAPKGAPPPALPTTDDETTLTPVLRWTMYIALPLYILVAIALTFWMWRAYLRVGSYRDKQVDCSRMTVAEIFPGDFFLGGLMHQRGVLYLHEFLERSAIRFPEECCVRTGGSCGDPEVRRKVLMGLGLILGDEESSIPVVEEEGAMVGMKNGEHGRPEGDAEDDHQDGNGVLLAKPTDKQNLSKEEEQPSGEFVDENDAPSRERQDEESAPVRYLSPYYQLPAADRTFLFEVTYAELNEAANRLARRLDLCWYDELAASRQKPFSTNVEAGAADPLQRQKLIAVLIPRTTWLPIAAQVGGSCVVLMLDVKMMCSPHVGTQSARCAFAVHGQEQRMSFDFVREFCIKRRAEWSEW